MVIEELLVNINKIFSKRTIDFTIMHLRDLRRYYYLVPSFHLLRLNGHMVVEDTVLLVQGLKVPIHLQ